MRINYDAAVKSLFNVSNSLILHLINYVFNEDLKEDEVELINLNREDSRVTVGEANRFMDMILENHTSGNRYHIEFQMKDNHEIMIRMFNYGYSSRTIEEEKEEIRIYFPKQAIIYLDKTEKIKDRKLYIILPDETEVLYKVEILKLFEKDILELEKHKLIMLLPLKLIDFKAYLKKGKIRGEDAKKVLDLFKETSRKILDCARKEDISSVDLNIILKVLDYLMRGISERMPEEAIKEARKEMDAVKEILSGDPFGIDKILNQGRKEGREEGREEGRKEMVLTMLKNGVADEAILKWTDLSKEELENIKMENQSD